LNWTVFCEREIVYIANGTRTADSVKQIFGPCVTQGIMFPFNAQVRCLHERGQDLHEARAVAEVSGNGISGGRGDNLEGWGQARWELPTGKPNGSGKESGNKGTEGYLELLRQMVTQYGILLSFYQDRHGSPKRNVDHWTLEDVPKDVNSPLPNNFPCPFSTGVPPSRSYLFNQT